MPRGGPGGPGRGYGGPGGPGGGFGGPGGPPPPPPGGGWRRRPPMYGGGGCCGPGCVMPMVLMIVSALTLGGMSSRKKH